MLILLARMMPFNVSDCSIAPSILSLFQVGSIRTRRLVINYVIMNFKGLIRSNIKSSWKETFIRPMNCPSCNKIFSRDQITACIHWSNVCKRWIPRLLNVFHYIEFIIFNLFNLIYLSFNSHLYCVITYI